MTGRNIVLQSINAPDGARCVDIFRRPDGRYGFEEYRRDPEDARGWFAIGGFGDRSFDDADAALRAARSRVAWLADAGA